jgi:hypothetical protein
MSDTTSTPTMATMADHARGAYIATGVAVAGALIVKGAWYAMYTPHDKLTEQRGVVECSVVGAMFAATPIINLLTLPAIIQSFRVVDHANATNSVSSSKSVSITVTRDEK